MEAKINLSLISDISKFDYMEIANIYGFKTQDGLEIELPNGSSLKRIYEKT